MRQVELSKAEVMPGALVGVSRRIDSLFSERAQTVPGIDGDGMGWIRDIEGALAEQAYAKAIDRYWDSSQWRFRSAASGDVGKFQVRHTTRLDGHLIVRPHDKEADRFVLVVGVCPHYQIVGSILGRDAKQPHFLNDPGGRGVPCWWVPQAALQP
jgi:hypothetical protein